MNEESEKIIMNLIVNGGNARSLSLKAVSAAEDGNLEEADQLLCQANEAIQIAHEAQSDIIRREMNGSPLKINLLMVHAQDHVMNAMTVRDLAVHLVNSQKDIQELKLLNRGVVK